MATGPGEAPAVALFAQLGRGHCMLLARDTWQETADWYSKKEAFPLTTAEEAWQNFLCLLPEGDWHLLRAPWCTRWHRSPTVHIAGERTKPHGSHHSRTLPLSQLEHTPGHCSWSCRATPQTHTRSHDSEHISLRAVTADCTLSFSYLLMWDVKLLAKLSQNIQVITCSIQNAKTQCKDLTLLYN